MKIVGRYELGEAIGHGGMAVVYLARQVDLDREVALKELRVLHAPDDPTQAERFLREARMAGSLSHPNIVTVLEHFEHEGTPYIAMEYLERGSLRPWIGHMTLAQIAGVLEGLLAALDHAEYHGIVHRDLKPENVLITRQGQAKVADFGIAKARTANQGTLTLAGSTVGTPTYMAPEQAMAKELGPYTDLYSIGVMAYEMIAGEIPFADTTNPFALATRHVNELIPSANKVNPSVDQELSDWIDRLLVKDPPKRTQTAEIAWDELENFIVGQLGSLWRREARLLTTTEQPVAPPLAPAQFTDLETPTPEQLYDGPQRDFESFDFDKPVRTVPTPEPLIAPEQDRKRPRAPSKTGFVTYDRPGTGPAPQKDKPEQDVAVVTPPPDVRVPTPPPEPAVREPEPEPIEAQAELDALLAEPAAEPLPDLDEPRHEPTPARPLVAARADTSAFTVMPDVVPDGLSPQPQKPVAAPKAPPSPQIRRRRVALVGGAATAVVAAVAVVAITSGGGEQAATTPQAPVAATSFKLTTPDLALTLPKALWSPRPDFPKVHGFDAEHGKAAQQASGAYLIAELVPAPADPTLLPAGLLDNLDDALPKAKTVTLAGRKTLVYDQVDIKGARAQLRIYATLTEDGVATVVCATPASTADCDTAARSLSLTSAKAIAFGPTRAYQSTITSISTTLDGRIEKLNGKLDKAKTLQGKATRLGEIESAYRKAITELRRAAPDLNPVDVGVNTDLTAAFRKAANAYEGLSSAVRKGNSDGRDRQARAAGRAIKRIKAARGALANAGYTGGPKVSPRTKVTFPRVVRSTTAVSGPTQNTPVQPNNTPQQSTPQQTFTPPPAANNPPPAANPPPASKPNVIIEE